FRHLHEVERAYDAGDLDLHARVTWRRPVAAVHSNGSSSAPESPEPAAAFEEEGLPVSEASDAAFPDPELDGAVTYESIQTTPGRIIFNTALPEDFEFVNDVVGKRKRSLASIVGVLADNYDRADVAESLDRIKDLTFRYAARSGLTISIDDVKT